MIMAQRHKNFLAITPKTLNFKIAATTEELAVFKAYPE